MATYKVLQDIEAEDKLLGPLTLKQFIFAAIAILIGFIGFKLLSTPGLGLIRWPFVLILLPPFAIFAFLAAPIGRDQPNDIWLLARLRFLLKPHKRVWNQDGLSQLVTVTAPQKIQQILTNDLSQDEVKSRLQALANTLDSRGWAVKNVDVNLFAQPDYLVQSSQTDRLVTADALQTDVPEIDIKASDDILDTVSNTTAQHLDQMVQAKTAEQRKRVIESIKQAAAPDPVTAQPPNDYWFLNQPSNQPADSPSGYTTFHNSQVVNPGSASQPSTTSSTTDEQAILADLEAHKEQEHQATSHLKTIQPSSPKTAQPTPTKTQTTTPNPAILGLANNDDLNVATIARQAKRISEADDEVVISLH
jgi:hypothetical protein